MSVALESASRLSALKSKIDTATGVSSSTLSEAVDNAIEKGNVQTEEKTVTPTASVQEVTPESGKYLSKVTVNAVPTQTKTVTPTENDQTVTPDSGKFLSSVLVKAAAASGKTVHKGVRYVDSYGISSLFVGVNLNEDDVFFMTQFGNDSPIPTSEGAYTRVVMRYDNGRQITGYFDATPDGSVSYPVWKTSETDPYYNVTYNGQYVNLKFDLSFGHTVHWVLIQ